MPWTCATCDVSLADDVRECAGCGAAKSAWTLADVTREFRITRKQVKAFRGADVRARPLEPRRDPELTPTERVWSVPRCAVRDLREREHGPAAAHRLYLVAPAGTAELTLEVAFARRDVAQLTAVTREAGDAAVAEVLLVHGPGETPALEGVTIVDVGEETERGCAPSIVVALGRRRTTLDVDALGEIPCLIEPTASLGFAPEDSLRLAADDGSYAYELPLGCVAPDDGGLAVAHLLCPAALGPWTLSLSHPDELEQDADHSYPLAGGDDVAAQWLDPSDPRRDDGAAPFFVPVELAGDASWILEAGGGGYREQVALSAEDAEDDDGFGVVWFPAPPAGASLSLRLDGDDAPLLFEDRAADQLLAGGEASDGEWLRGATA